MAVVAGILSACHILWHNRIIVPVTVRVPVAYYESVAAVAGCPLGSKYDVLCFPTFVVCYIVYSIPNSTKLLSEVLDGYTFMFCCDLHSIHSYVMTTTSVRVLIQHGRDTHHVLDWRRTLRPL